MTRKEFLNAVANGEVDLVQLLLDILAETGAPYCVIGGLAVNAYAEPVVSLDLDIVVALGSVESACAAARARGLEAERFEHSVSLRSDRSDLRIQLQMDARYQPFISRAVEREVLGYRMRVAALPDLLQGRLWAYQDESRRRSKRQKDLADILRLVEAHPGLEKRLPPGLAEPRGWRTTRKDLAMAMASKQFPPRLRRSESFLGIHFDHHMNERCTEVGKHVSRRMVERIIDLVQPDYIQCDCKGHRGLCSFPSKLGNGAPGFVRDQLKIWREATARRGVALYMHYSGVWDNEAVARHPSWARIDEKGKRDKQKASVFGPYVDKLLIPQLKELCDGYGVDGVWVDGECWATVHDYCREAVAEFREKTGLRTVPKKPEDPGFFEFSEICREAFRIYLEHYVSALHRHDPSFQIASNWAYSSFMPEPVGIDVDFISGDYSMQNSVNAARLEGRCMARQGKPWDLMAWSFAEKWGEGAKSTKSVPQLQREAAVVLALGGGFQAYFKQKADGSINDWQMALMAEVAKFCRARQAVCHRAEAVPQVGLIYSGAAHYRTSPRLFAPWQGELTPMAGVLRSLLESQHSVEILMEHHLAGRMGEYPLLVVPEWDCLEPKFRGALLSYVEAGGSLLLVGPKAAAMFQKQLRVRLLGKPEAKAQWLEHDGWLCGMKTLSQRVKLGKGAKPFGRLYAENDVKGPFEAAASIARHGKGRIAATYLNLGERYANAATPTARRFLAALVRELFPRPMVEVTGSQYVDVCVNRIGGRLAVNLVNTAGPHGDSNVHAFDEIPPVGPLSVVIRAAEKPRKVTLEPAGTRLRHTWEKGEIRLTLPRLEIHGIILVE